MSSGTAARTTRPGDLVVISGHHVGDRERSGEIVELVGNGRYRVRWDDGHESIFYPGSDAFIKHTRRGSNRRT